jgi:phage-related protein
MLARPARSREIFLRAQYRQPFGHCNVDELVERNTLRCRRLPGIVEKRRPDVHREIVPHHGALTDIDKFVNGHNMRNTRPISWLKAALKDFEAFPAEVQLEVRRALTVAAEGGKSDKAKPFKGVGGGVFEIALRRRGDAFRAIYAVQIGADLWVIHAFQKKSKTGIKTPKAEVDLIRERLKRLKDLLR